MPRISLVLFLVAASLLGGCKLTLVVPEGGSVTTVSGAYSCEAANECEIDVVDTFFDEEFQAVPAEGYEFVGWKKRTGGFCGTSFSACKLSTVGFEEYEILLEVLESDLTYYLEPEFRSLAEERIGFEVLQVISPSEIKAWATPQITLEEYQALEVPQGWIKNQPRESDFDASQFLRSPDGAEEGDYSSEEFFGYEWLHVATVVEVNIALDEGGLFSGTRVSKYHEVSFNPGSTVVVLVSPDKQAYFRIGRDALRTTDEFDLPEGWLLTEIVAEEELVFDLFEGNLVIRTSNEDSFQGPIPELLDLI